jgi:outer membrane protein assembly factor BamB
MGPHVFTLAEPTNLICLRATDGQVEWTKSHNYEDFLPAAKAREIAVQLAEAQKVQERIDQLQKQRTEKQKSDPAAEDTELKTQLEALQQQYEKMTPFPAPRTDGAGNTTSTPVTDGRFVWASFANGIVSSHSVDGSRNWMHFIEKPNPRHTSSPVLSGDLLIVHFKQLTALDAATGQIRWQVATPPRNGTPVLARVAENEWIITPAGSVVRVKDGHLVAEKLFDLAYCSPIVQDDIVYAVERGTTKAIQLAEPESNEVAAKVLWEIRGAEDDRLASPLIHDGLLYSIGGKGIFEVVDAKTGERVYRKRLDFGNGRPDPSVAKAGDVLFVSNNLGSTLLLKTGRNFELVSRNELEGFSSSPFFEAGRLYIRAPKHLYCLGE